MYELFIGLWNKSIYSGLLSTCSPLHFHLYLGYSIFQEDRTVLEASTIMAHQQDFDLALDTSWFTKEPPAFPLPSMKALGPCTSTYDWTWEQDPTDTTKTLICAVLWTDTKAVTKVRVTWKRSNPMGTVKAEQKHYPTPPPVSAENLDKAYKRYGENIALWAESSVGTRVGDGECWTFIHHALADLAESYRQYGEEPPLVSQGRTHGQPILTLTAPSVGTNGGLLQLADVRRGDILELTSAHFQIITEEAPQQVPGAWGTWKKGAGEKNVRLNHHTAIVVGVKGDAVKVLEQNGCVPGGVGETRYDLGGAGMKEGKVVVFRVIGETMGGGGPLTAKWEDE